MDLEALVTDELRDEVQAYTLEWFDVEASSRRPPHATVAVRTPDDEVVQGSFTGDGPVDAIFRAINSATTIDARLREFRVDAVTGGQDALGEVSVVVELGSPEEAIQAPYPGVLSGARVTGAGQAVATDIIEAAAIAYVRALGNAIVKAQAAADQPGPGELAPTP
jgi:2-isopropylmalate synthase